MIAENKHPGDLINAAQRAAAAMVGARVRAKRNELDLSILDLAERLGLHPSKLERIEAGEDRMSVTDLGSMSSLLAVPISWFFETTEFAPSEPAAAPGQVDLDTTLPADGPPTSENAEESALAAEIITKFMMIHDQSLRRSILRFLMSGDETDEDG